MVSVETEIAVIFGPLLNQDYRHIWSLWCPRLQAYNTTRYMPYMVPILTEIAGIIVPPDILLSIEQVFGGQILAPYIL